MSRKLRIGNDVGVFWTLKDADGNPYNLRGRDIAVEIVIWQKKYRVKELELTADNTIHFVYWGKDQKYTGFCDLKFIENDGLREMVTFDISNAFTLVPHSWQAIDEGETPETIQIEVVSIASELVERVGPKGDTGDPAGFGSVTADVDTETGSPSVEVTTSGPNTAKNFHFAFSGLKGEDGSDADVTSQNIERALGYVPVSPDDMPFEAGDGTNSAVQKGSNNTAFGESAVVEGKSVTSAEDNGIDAESTYEEIVTAWENAGDNKFSLAKGEASHIEGTNNLALAKNSHAEGNGTIAGNNSAHSEGTGSQALGKYSHAEGLESIASGDRSHSEGKETTASGNGSHAEGDSTQAAGKQAHAEGKLTNASKENSHAEGYYTTASENQAHAEGHSTVASGNSSHAEGKETLASGAYSHAEGEGSDGGGNTYGVASGQASHSEGSSRATGLRSHSEGDWAIASGQYSHAEGSESTASGKASHSEGRSDAIGKFSHAEGNRTVAGNGTRKNKDTSLVEGDATHSEGSATLASGLAAHAEGERTQATGSHGSHAEGWASLAQGGASHSEGVDTIAYNYAEHAEGEGNISIPGVTRHTVGIGTENSRKNAHTITTDGKHYIPGVGTYQGTETTLPAGQDLASVLATFITKSVNDLTNYYLKSDTYTKAEVQALIAAISQFHYEVYASLSEVTSPANNVLYLIGPTGSGTDKYKEYVWPNASLGFVLIGDTSIDLSGYVTTQALNTALADYTATANLAAVALSGSYNDLLNKPTIPTVPEISTDIDADGASDAKTASPKAVKSFVEGKGYGTYSKPSGGIPASDLASGVIPDVLGKEDSSNKVTSLSASSTDTQYPSAKAVYDALYENVLISLGVNSAGTASDLIGLKVTVTNADTSEQISEQTWNGTPLVVRIKAGVRYTVSVQAHPDYVTPASQTFTSELASTRSVGFIYVYSAVIDLSYRDTDGTKKMAQDTANSYVARVAGDYKLPAVYGNAIKNGATNSAAYTRQGSTYTADFVNYKGTQITSPYIETDTGETIASAVLLWQTGTNLISNVAFSNGYVTFTVNSIPAENGLAVLAVKDGNGDIMWSWTIWLTTDTLTAEKFTNYTEVDYYIMPENLFCIWNEQRTNYGTAMIQWGRKDAFVPNVPGSGSQMTVYDIEGNAITAGTALGSVIGVFGSDNDQSADKTVANAIKNPGMFFTRYDSTNNNWNNLAWFNNFWNAAETSSASMADNQDTAIKTIYDPCPFGWMLPAGRAFTGFTTTGGNASTAAQFNVVGSWNAGWNFKRNSEDTTGNKFTASGCRANGSGALTRVGSNGYYWSFAPYSQTYARNLDFNSGYVLPSDNSYRAYGFAVRPSRE